MSVTFLNRVLNVSDNEWPRIILGWCLHLFLRAGFVIGWTVTIAMFINRMGIEALPYLFVLNALMVMLGTILYSHLLKIIKRPALILYTTLMAGALLLLATLFTYSSDLAFLGLILIAQSILLSQLNILISLFTEDLFSPLESQRTFPLIATSETIGGILGGLTVGLLVEFLPAYKFIYLWILLILLIIPTLLTSHSYSKRIPSLKISNTPRKTSPKNLKSVVPRAMRNFQKIKKIPFLKGIMVIVALQFMVFNLLEFQYTKAIQAEVAKEQTAIQFEVNDYQPDTSLQVSLLDIHPIENEAHETSAHIDLESELSKKLGMLQAIFFGGSLIVQILFASRIISSLGIVSSLLLHPLVTLLNLIGMTWNFSFLSASIGRSSFEITGGIFRNAYHSSYYAITENMRGLVKEILEGFVKPLGAVLAFVAFYITTQFASGASETLVINLIMIALLLAMTLRLVRLEGDYTLLSHRHLASEHDLPTRLNAIEILAQKGHQIDCQDLIKYLKSKKERKQIKLKILETLQELQDLSTIPDILDCLKNKDREIRLAAIEALMHFDQLKEHLTQKAFTHHRIIEEIKTLFQYEQSSTIRVACIELLAKMEDKDLIPFIISTMTLGDEPVKRACIKACGRFKDPNIIQYIKMYLDDKNAKVRAETIGALWQFKKLRKTLRHYLEQMKKSQKKSGILATLLALGEIGEKQELPYLIRHLASAEQDIRHAASKAMCKLNHPAAIPHIAEFLMHENKALAENTKKFMKHIPESMVDSIEQLVRLRVSAYIHDILKETHAEALNELDIQTLKKLQNAYATVDNHEEVYKIEKIILEKLKTRSSLKPMPHVIPA